MVKRVTVCIAVATALVNLGATRDAWAAGGQVVVVETAPVVVVGPSPGAPVARAAQGGALLLGLGLIGAGLVAGGAGFAVLYACQQGTSCYSDTTQVVGWTLAAPGIVPLAIGSIIVYGVAQGNGRRASAPRVGPIMARWAFTAGPLPGGAFAGVALTF